MTAQERVEKAKAMLLLSHPWWASLLLHLHISFTDAIPTMATNGTDLLINPSFVDGLGSDDIQAVLLHEVGHCALLHPYRRMHRDPIRWNIAADQAVNALLEADGISLPKGCIPAGPIDKTVEELYEKVKTKSLPMADLLDAGDRPSGDKEEMSEKKWADAIASMRGIEPKSISRRLQEVHEPKIDWKDELAIFASATVKSESRSWSRLSRRIATGPGKNREPQSKISICIDTSGSIQDGLLSSFASEAKWICALMGIEAWIISADAAVSAIYQPGDDWEDLPGGGGTDFRPALKASLDREVDAVLYFTDGYGEYGDPIHLPVLWTMPAGCPSAPWGKTITIN